MKLIKPNVELIKQEPGIEGIYKQIERAGRICYKSEDKITEDSAKKFVDMLIKNGHGAMLEHSTVYLKVEFKANTPSNAEAYYIWNKYNNNKYSISLQIQPIPGNPDGFVAITTNFRVLVENSWLDDLEYLCEPTEYHKKRYTLKFTTSIGITRELVRHRHMSFACESTRYCNYSKKDKFGGEVSFCIPEWVEIPEGNAYWYDGINYRVGVNEDDPMKFLSINPRALGDENKATQYALWLNSIEKAERNYMSIIRQGWQPQQAREVLPLCTKAEIIMTGFESDWKAFFKLRCDKAAHPDMQIIANKAKELLKF